MLKLLAGSMALMAIMAAIGPVRAADAEGAVWTSAWSEGYNSKIRLVATRASRAASGETAKPGTYVAGIEIALAPKWKTYWRNPGDAGVPPSFDLAASENVASAIVKYPAPTRYTDKAGDAIGYKGTVIFPIEITAKDPAKTTVLKVKAEYGVCDDICIPAEADLSLALDGVAAVDTTAGAPIAKALSDSRARVPQSAKGAAATAPSLVGTDDQRTAKPPKLVMTANFKGGANPQIYVEAPDSLYVPLPRRIPDAADGSARFEVDLSKGIDLADFNGKTLRITIVSDAGAIETEWLLK